MLNLPILKFELTGDLPPQQDVCQKPGGEGGQGQKKRKGQEGRKGKGISEGKGEAERQRE